MTRHDLITRIVVPLVAAFGGAIISGLLVWQLDPNWDIRARQEGWIPATACPSEPLVLQFTGPGDGATVPLYYPSGKLGATLVVSASRPFADHEQLGVVVSYAEGVNYYVVFPTFELLQNRRAATTAHHDIWLPHVSPEQKQTTFWAVAVSDRRTVGEVYSSLTQITSLSAIVAVSAPIRLKHGT